MTSRVEQFMSLSLAAEPRRKGLFEPYFWQRPSAQQPPHNALLPLLFPEALPTVSLVDRSQVVRGRVDSDASHSNGALGGRRGHVRDRHLVLPPW